MYSFTVYNPCLLSPCDQECGIDNNTYFCGCTEGYVLAADGISCIQCAKPTESDTIKPTWQVAICNASNNDTICSGTTISDQWVLTSARCACRNGVGIEGLSYRFGKEKTCSYEDTGEVQRLASKIYCYSTYDPDILTVDIAAVKLESPIPIDVIQQSQPLCIDNVKEGKKLFFTGGKVQIFGWGIIGKAVENEATLRSTGTIIVDATQECKSVFKKEKVKYRARGGAICTLANTTSSCIGNYGSAVVSSDEDTLYFGAIVGRSTSECGVTGSYIAHSRLFAKDAFDWISNVTKS